MDWALIGTIAMMGAAGSPHCLAMCAAPCAAVCAGSPARSLQMQAGRLIAYAGAGAVAAASVQTLGEWVGLSAALRPLWALLQASIAALGFWMLWRGAWPRWAFGARVAAAGLAAGASGATAGRVGAAGPVSGPSAVAAAWVPMAMPRRRGAFGAGLAWVLWPCGMLHAALVLAAMARDAASGAAAMAAFAAASSPAILAGGWALGRLGPGNQARRDRFSARLAGGALLLAAVWALGAGVWHRVAAFCGLA